MADELVEIADGSGDDSEKFTNRDRLRIDTRKWLLSKALPKVFGDRFIQEHVGPNGGPINCACRPSVAVRTKISPIFPSVWTVSQKQRGARKWPCHRSRPHALGSIAVRRHEWLETELLGGLVCEYLGQRHQREQHDRHQRHPRQYGRRRHAQYRPHAALPAARETADWLDFVPKLTINGTRREALIPKGFRVPVFCPEFGRRTWP
jgi:hypothetical protein